MQRFKRAFMLACDVEKRPQRKNEKTHSGWQPAKKHFGSGTDAHPEGKLLYGDLRLLGAKTLIDMKGTERLVIPGKVEQRYGQERIWIDGLESEPWQGYLLRKILTKDLGVDPTVVEWIKSDGGTVEAIRAILGHIQEHGLQYRDVAIVTNGYHLERVYQILQDARAYEVRILSAESLLLMEDEKNRAVISNKYKGPDFLRRMGDEWVGVAAWLKRAYAPKRHGWKKMPTFR